MPWPQLHPAPPPAGSRPLAASPAIIEKRVFVSLADLGCGEPSLAQQLLQPRAEQGTSRGFAELSERTAGKPSLASAPGES